MNRQLQVATLVCAALTGCSEPTRPTVEVLVGEYIYKSEDPEAKPSDHNFDHLTLRADGTYDLVKGGTTKPKSETVGSWKWWDGGGQGLELLLGHDGYPIQIKGDEVRLLIDNDVGIWFAKVRRAPS